MKRLVDTNIVSALMRQQAQVLKRWRKTRAADLLIPAVVVAEGLTGARKAGAERWLAAWRRIAQVYEIVPFDIACAEEYAHVRSHLEAGGCMIGLHDCEIAASALAWQQQHADERLVVVTDNEDEFRRVPGLRVENWLSRGS